MTYPQTDVTPELFDELDELAPEKALDRLIGALHDAGEFGLAFEARLMKRRHELGMPLIQTDMIEGAEYQQSVVQIARETGESFLAAGNIVRAWPYFRAVGETRPIEDAIQQVENGDEGVISIAFQEGLHPLKGLELILNQHGMCRALTAFGMTAVQKDRDKCIALLARRLRDEIAENIAATIEAREGSRPPTTSLAELIAGRDWLFGEWDYYTDTSHVLSIVPYGVELRDPAQLALFQELCEYGERLHAQLKSPGVPPFEDQFVAYGHYIQALLGLDTETHLGYFRRQVAECDPDVAGDAPGRTLARLLIALDRIPEALEVVVNHVIEDAPWGTPVPTAIQLSHQAGDFARMRELARERGDAISYAAATILSGGR